MVFTLDDLQKKGEIKVLGQPAVRPSTSVSSSLINIPKMITSLRGMGKSEEDINRIVSGALGSMPSEKKEPVSPTSLRGRFQSAGEFFREAQKSGAEEFRGTLEQGAQPSIGEFYKNVARPVMASMAEGTAGALYSGAAGFFKPEIQHGAEKIKEEFVSPFLEKIPAETKEQIFSAAKGIYDLIPEDSKKAASDYLKILTAVPLVEGVMGAGNIGLKVATGLEKTLGTTAQVSKGVSSIVNQAKGGVSKAVEVIGEARKARIIENRIKELSRLQADNAPLRKAIFSSESKGIDVKSELAKTDLLTGAVDNTGTVRTQGAIDTLNNFIKPQEDIISRSLKAEGKIIPLLKVESELVGAVNNSGVKGGAKIRALQNVEQDIKGYKLEALDENGKPWIENESVGEPQLSISTVHDAKVDKYANINYLNPESNRIDKVIAKKLKELTEKYSESVDVKGLNKELSKWYSVQNLLEKLDGKKVAGGKLGKYFAQTIGAVVGSHFGPVGAMAGAEVGGIIKGLGMSSKFGRKTGALLEESSAMKSALKNASSYEKSLGSRKTNQSATKINVNVDTNKNIQLNNEKVNTKSFIKTKPNPNPAAPTAETRGFKRAKNLSPENRVIETKAFEKIVSSENELLRKNKILHKNVVNTDNFRPFFKDVGYNGINSVSVQEPASYLSKKAYTEGLKNEGDVIGSAGGSGVGKTSGIKNIPSLKKITDEASVVLDSNFSTYNSAINKIREAMNAGKEFKIIYTYRDFLDSLENGIVKRMFTNPEEMGRIVPVEVAAENHIGSWDVIKKLYKEGVDGHNLDIKFLDNTNGKGKAKLISFDEMNKKINYPSINELKKIGNAKIKELAKGNIVIDGKIYRITPEQVKEYIN